MMEKLSSRTVRIAAIPLYVLCVAQAHANVISHNGTADSSPPGSGDVNILFQEFSLTPSFHDFFELATHELEFAYNDPSTPGHQVVTMSIQNDSSVSWTELRLLLEDGDFYGHPLSDPVQTPAIDPVHDENEGPFDPGQIGFNDPFAPFSGPVTLAGSSILRFNDQGSGFLDAEVTIHFDDPMDSGERITLFFAVFPSPGAAGAGGFTLSVTPVPEPATGMLLGALGIAGLIRRRKPQT